MGSARDRVAEHINSRLKIFRILAERDRNRRRRFALVEKDFRYATQTAQSVAATLQALFNCLSKRLN